jgi:uncharacterized protein with FMN-binding domain
MTASSTKLLALCTLAVGVVYASGYVYTERGAEVVPSAASVTGSHAAKAPSGSSGSAPPSSSSSSVPSTPTSYKDGTYTGSAANPYGTLSVSVTVAGGKITSVQITSYNMHYPQSFIDPTMNQEVVSNQTYNVYMVTGATASSYNFVQAVQSALQKAKA